MRLRLSQIRWHKLLGLNWIGPPFLVADQVPNPQVFIKPEREFSRNVNEIDLGTDGTYLTNFDYFSQAYREILENNGEPNAAIFAPRTWYTLDTLKDTTNQPLVAPMSFQNIQKLITNQIPIDITKGGSDDASLAFLGDFTKMLIGIRTSLKLEVTRVGSHSDGSGSWDSSAWEQLQVWVRAYLRADIQLAQPAHFSVINGIILHLQELNISRLHPFYFPGHE